MRWLIDACYLVAAVLFAPILVFRSVTTGKYRRDWDQRRGFLPELSAADARVWFHAVSMGEVNALRGLVADLRRRSPETDVVVSCTTDTGIDRARQIFPDLTVVRYPLDFSWFVRRALRRIKPTMIVLVELEVWPQFVFAASARGIPVAVINGRITASKSLRWFRPVLPLVRPMFRRLAWVGAQDEVYAERFARVGVPADRITVTRSIKWDTAQIVDSVPGSDAWAAAMGIDREQPCWVCGSTGPGEEAVILDAFVALRAQHPELQLIIVPRKPERFDEVADLIGQRGLACARRSEHPDGAVPPGDGTAVRLGDSMGELRKVYALADVVFVGRTLADMGGSDMMEVAALARPIVIGPHTENFEDAAIRFARAGALRTIDGDLTTSDVADRLARAVGELMAHPEDARRLAEAGREVVRQNLGATDRTLDRILEILARAQRRPS